MSLVENWSKELPSASARRGTRYVVFGNIYAFMSHLLHQTTILWRSMHRVCLIGFSVHEQEAWDWVASLEEVDAVKFHLASSFPRKVFTEEELRGTLEQLGLAPQAALFVQVADDE